MEQLCYSNNMWNKSTPIEFQFTQPKTPKYKNTMDEQWSVGHQAQEQSVLVTPE